ncbi:hypothetical protein D4740_07895 [Actinomyces sp. 2119]|uniref:NlpC/P60 domain-containing protein n=1 Tax=Actinomyces lilanjuaniae TaxID=2321394 RepID=A0ABN5PLV4_9ACTO|nr:MULTISPECIES: hypothetical protein [Actinomyces]AYD89220.1 hypothetical protein D5R93_02570 [Actinomyces lilanjuaniae]RJF41969.1 hypothetical protein D4740_07895 [Actinomyces sp. 2119]
MAETTSISRRGITFLGAALLASPTISWVPAAAAPGSVEATQYDTLYDLLQASNPSGTVWTRGDELAGDGAGVTYAVESSRPSGRLGNVSMLLANGKWAVPQSFSTQPARSTSTAAADDLISRGQSFVDAGTRLGWDGNGLTPLTGQVVHQVASEPYAVSCSTFVGMAVLGWDYQHTTYVADQNTKVGYYVDFGDGFETSRAWSANNLASWFYARGDVWLDVDNHYERGDIMFFSDPDRNAVTGGGVGARTIFGNVYHAAIYLGDGMLMHSTGVAAGQGVHVSKMWNFLKKDLSFVARPAWSSL